MTADDQPPLIPQPPRGISPPHPHWKSGRDANGEFQLRVSMDLNWDDTTVTVVLHRVPPGDLDTILCKVGDPDVRAMLNSMFLAKVEHERPYPVDDDFGHL